jgi:hypothetical protein
MANRMIVLAVCVCLCASSALGVVEGLTDTSAFTTPGGDWEGMNWDYVGSIGNGSAVAVGSRYLLTNRHFNPNVGQTVVMDSGSYTVTEVINAPVYDGKTPDLRLLKVDDTLPGYYDIYTGIFNKPNKNLIIVGTGYSGTIDVPSDSYTYSAATGRQKRWGTNEFSSFQWVPSGSYNSYCLQMNFDVGDSQYESGLASGDSGSGIFFEDGGEWKLAAVGAYIGAQGGATPPYDVNWGISMFLHGAWIEDAVFIAGDFNDDGWVDGDDIDLLCDNLGDSAYDLDDDGDADADDFTFLVENLVGLTTGGTGTALGDFNLDGAVNGTDLSIMSASFGLVDAGWAQGNANCDSIVDGTDLSILSSTFGFLATSFDPAAVPEPLTLVMLTAGGAVVLRRRRR